MVFVNINFDKVVPAAERTERGKYPFRCVFLFFTEIADFLFETPGIGQDAITTALGREPIDVIKCFMERGTDRLTGGDIFADKLIQLIKTQIAPTEITGRDPAANIKPDNRRDDAGAISSGPAYHS